MSTENQPPFILIDGSAYLHRAYHALPPLTTSEGISTGAVFGVVKMLKNLLDKYHPKQGAIVFDKGGKTFREDIYPEYKANRPPAPDDLIQQAELLNEIIPLLGFPLLSKSGVEADDVIGTLAQQAAKMDQAVLIFTGDKDFAQLVNDKIHLVDTMRHTHLDISGVIEKFSVSPEQIIDYFCLVGDSADNIPGVNKVGPKTAAKWLKEYHSLENIIENADKFKGKIGENLRQTIALFPTIRELLTIRCDLELSKKVDELTFSAPDNEKLHILFEKLEFKQLLSDFPVKAKKVAPIVKHYETVLTQKDLKKWLKIVQKSDIFSFDVETNSLDYLDAELVGVSFAVKPHEAAYIPFSHFYLGAPQQLDRNDVLALLKPLLENPQKKKVGQNLKFDAHILKNYDIELQGIYADTMLESYVINSTTKHDMDSLASQYLGVKTITFEDIAGKGKKQLTFDKIDLSIAAPYATEDADITLQLHHTLSPRLQKMEKMQAIYQNIELPLLPVLTRMERCGVKIDADALYRQSLELANQLQSLEQQVHQLAGEVFNLNSPKQLQKILFEKLQLPILKKSPKGDPSTAESVLQELALEYPLPKLILAFRSLSKLKSTYTDSLPQQIHPKTGRVHTSYHQAVTVTGRLSSSNPNLQNIPIRTQEGRRIRQAFIAPEDYCLLTADYSQIELRIMAYLSQDEKLLTSFANQEDIHQATAAEVFDLAINEVTAEQRRQAKAVNFGLIYGMAASGLSQQLQVSREEAQQYIDTYFARYPKVKLYMEETRKLAKHRGYVETVFGRRLYIPDIRSRHYQRQQYAERSAINAPLQGTAADIIKKAMISLDEWIRHSQFKVNMVMQVHDELVFEVAKEEVNVVSQEIKNLMEMAAEEVGVPVNIGVGDNWDVAH